MDILPYDDILGTVAVAERFGERRASTMVNSGTVLAARPFDLKLGWRVNLDGPLSVVGQRRFIRG
jgi:hypothetical protein